MAIDRTFLRAANIDPSVKAALDTFLDTYDTFTGSVDAAELDALDGAASTNAVAGKAAILGTAGAIEFGGAVTAVGSFIIGSADMSEADLEQLDGITAGTVSASKALVVDASKMLSWAVSSASTDGGSSVESLVVNTTMTGVGGVGGRARFELDTNVALGAWANALKAQLQLGASGKVTGLGSAFVAELIMGAGAADGTYAALELELGMPTGALTGTETAFINMTAYGDDASTLDTNGFLFSISGVTKNTGKLLADTTSGSTARPVQVLRVKTPDGTRYLPLYSTVAIAA